MQRFFPRRADSHLGEQALHQRLVRRVETDKIAPDEKHNRIGVIRSQFSPPRFRESRTSLASDFAGSSTNLLREGLAGEFHMQRVHAAVVTAFHNEEMPAPELGSTFA